MALVECPECTRQISSYAETCPTCGAPSSMISTELGDEKFADKLVALIFWALFGLFGAHKLYLNKSSAIFHFLLGLVSFVLVLANPITLPGTRLRDCGALGYRADCLPGYINVDFSMPPLAIVGAIGLAIAGLWAIFDLVSIPAWVVQKNASVDSFKTAQARVREEGNENETSAPAAAISEQVSREERVSNWVAQAQNRRAEAKGAGGRGQFSRATFYLILGLLFIAAIFVSLIFGGTN